MGLIILPLMLGMFLVFLVPGLRTGWRAVAGSASRARALALLAAMALVLNLALMAGLFGLAALAGAPSAFGFLLSAMAGWSLLAWLSGRIYRKRFARHGRRADGLAAAAIFLATAAFPIGWFALAGRLEALFHVAWRY